MKTLHAEFGRQTTEPAVPFPTTTPRTEEIIIPSENSVEGGLLTERYHQDDAYPLVHKMIFDLVKAQRNVFKTHSIEDFNLALKIEEHIVEHVSREIRRGYIAETPLELSHNPREDAFTLHVAKRYVEAEAERIRQFGPDTTVIQPDFIQQTLFDSNDDLHSSVLITSQPAYATLEQPAHITTVPVEQLSAPEQTELHTFNEIVKKLGGKVAQVFGVSFQSGEIPITKVIPVQDHVDSSL